MKLKGIRVLDLSQFLPGPHLTMTLADYGADVIMVEPANGVERTRRRRLARARRMASRSGFAISRAASAAFTLDLTTNPKWAEGSFSPLADEAGADVFVEAFRPGVAKRLGIDYETVAARNPRIVYCAISAFGQNGPYRDRPAHDLAVQALVGTADLARGTDDKPALPNLTAADMAASLTALSAILMALLARAQTG